MLVALGLAFAAWLVIVPTSTQVGVDGGVSGCHTPVLNMSDSAAESGAVDFSCLERNRLRVTKALYALAGVVVLLSADSLVRFWREPTAKAPRGRQPKSWYDDA